MMVRVTVEDFIRAYEAALATQRWGAVEPLLRPDACVTFSSGAVHKGKAAVQAAFERNFALIRDETYRISNVHWAMRTPDFAVYLFDFAWTGLIDGKPAAGAGRGTAVLVHAGDSWQLLTEHLGPAPAT
jgi:ketosteroid isomerase-like protein